MKNFLFIIIIMITGIFFSCQEDPMGIAESDSEIQLKATDELDSNVVEDFNRLGVNDSGIIGIQRRLLEIGIPRDKINSVMRVIPVITREILAEGADFELSVRVKNYLENELRLTGDQTEVVIGIATRIANIQRSRG